jgi:hypothetical protein
MSLVINLDHVTSEWYEANKEKNFRQKHRLGYVAPVLFYIEEALGRFRLNDMTQYYNNLNLHVDRESIDTDEMEFIKKVVILKDGVRFTFRYFVAEIHDEAYPRIAFMFEKE